MAKCIEREVDDYGAMQSVFGRIGIDSMSFVSVDFKFGLRATDGFQKYRRNIPTALVETLLSIPQRNEIMKVESTQSDRVTRIGMVSEADIYQ